MKTSEINGKKAPVDATEGLKEKLMSNMMKEAEYKIYGNEEQK